MRLHSRPYAVTACVAAVLVGLSGCGGEGEGTDTTSSTASSTSSEPTYDKAHIMGKVQEVNETFHGLDPNAKIPADAGWVTDAYREKYNDDQDEYKKMGVEQKGKVSTTSLHLAESDRNAPGGWDVTVYNCSVSTVRAYIDGEDVTADPENPDKALPKGPRESVFLDRYSTPDGGKTWQLDDVQRLSGKDEEEAPCAR